MGAVFDDLSIYGFEGSVAPEKGCFQVGSAWPYSGGYANQITGGEVVSRMLEVDDGNLHPACRWDVWVLGGD
jgi:hypothetical protein